jgi:hypothetical protein
MRTKLRCFVVLMLLALPAAVRAQFNYTTNNGTITITQYTGTGGAVTIPNTITGLPVTTIAQDAFFQDNTLTSVTLGTNVTTLAPAAIFQCPALVSVSIPASVTNIQAGAIVDDLALTTISVNASNQYYTNMSEVLFNKSLTSLIAFPGGVTGSYTIPATVTNVGDAFIGNSLTSILVNLTNLYYASTNGVLCSKNLSELFAYPGAAPGSYTVPGTVTAIISAAFEYSVGVAGVTFGTNVNYIGDLAFYDCTNLAAFSVNPASTYFSSTNGALFDINKTDLIQYPVKIGGSYTIPGTVNNIGDGAFGDDFTLTGVTIPNSVTNIGFEVFYGDENLASVTLGNHVANIGSSAFFYCTSLTDVAFPATVTNIAAYAFGACTSLSSVCFEGQEPVDGGSIFLDDNFYDLSTILYVSIAPGWGSTYDGIATTPCSTCGGEEPELAITRSGSNVIVTWPTNFTGFTLLSSTNLGPSAVWITNTPAPGIVNTNYSVTNPASGARKFYGLIQ